jgi:hypothetical protein
MLIVILLDGGLFGGVQGSFCHARQMPPLCADQERVMADTMQLLTAVLAGVLLYDQPSRSSRLTRREGVMKPAPSLAFARLAKGLTLALAMIAGTAAATGFAAANENPIVFIPPLGGEAVSMTDSEMPLMLDWRDIPTVDPDPASQFHGKVYRELGAERVPIPHPNARAASSRPGRGGLGVPALPNLPRLW